MSSVDLEKIERIDFEMWVTCVKRQKEKGVVDR